MCCNPTRPLQESPGPSGPGIPKKSQKESPGAFRPRGPKSVRNSLETVSGVSKTVYFEAPETVSRLFRTLFGRRGRKAPGDSFETLLGFRARRARETPVRGGRGCKRCEKIALCIAAFRVAALWCTKNPGGLTSIYGLEGSTVS